MDLRIELEKARVEIEAALLTGYLIEDETERNAFYVKSAHEVHNLMHHIGRIASIAPLTEALRQEESGEVKRLKDIIKFYREYIDKYGLPRHAKDY